MVTAVADIAVDIVAVEYIAAVVHIVAVAVAVQCTVAGIVAVVGEPAFIHYISLGLAQPDVAIVSLFQSRHTLVLYAQMFFLCINYISTKE